MNELNKIYLRKAQKFVQKLAGFEFIKLIALTGSLAKFNSNNQSDIDFFVVAKSGTIWTARAACLSLSQLTFSRAKKNDEAGKFCFNRFSTSDFLKITPENKYHANEYSSFLVLLNKDDTLKKFIKKNQWIKKYSDFKFNFNYIINPKNTKRRFSSKKLNNLIEKFSRSCQISRFKKNKFYHQQNSKLVYNDKEIYFFENPL